MAWLGMDPDEGPYRQSERTAALPGGASRRSGVRASSTPATAPETKCSPGPTDNATPGYDGFCRDRGLERGPGRALRFRTRPSGDTVVHDLIRGEVRFPNDAMEDFVAVKSSGQPLFVLANVVDDRDMAITHVIRGEDLLPTTPKGVLLWEALDQSAGQPSAPGSRVRPPARCW